MDFARRDPYSGDEIDDYTTDYPRGFFDLALVSRAFAAAVRLCVYEHVKIRGRENFLVLNGQLRVLPALGSLVRHAHLTSTCLRNGTMNPNNSGDEDDIIYEEVHSISTQSFRWFLEAVPNLVSLDMNGFDALAALTAKSILPTLAGLKNLKTIEVGHFGPHKKCDAYLASKPLWLAALFAIPGLQELELMGVSIALDDPYVRQIPSSFQSTVTSLAIHNIHETLEGAAVRRLVGICPALSELILAGDKLHLLGIESIIRPLRSRLVTFALHGKTFSHHPQPQLEALPAVLSRCTHLEVLAISTLSISPTLLSNIPPSLRHLHLDSLPLITGPDVVDWLRTRSTDTNGRLNKLALTGSLFNHPQPIGARIFEVPKVPKTVERALRTQCRRLGIALELERQYALPHLCSAHYTFADPVADSQELL
ncbi:hypothetical protein RQP46_009768 [Phenoliferia psychrophenolica]